MRRGAVGIVQAHAGIDDVAAVHAPLSAQIAELRPTCGQYEREIADVARRCRSRTDDGQPIYLNEGQDAAARPPPHASLSARRGASGCSSFAADRRSSALCVGLPGWENGSIGLNREAVTGPALPHGTLLPQAGEAACIGAGACLFNSGDISKVSCRGLSACIARVGPVGENACVGEEACEDSGPGRIGNGACRGERACLNNPGPIAKGACVGQPDPGTGRGVCEVVEP